MKVKPSTVVPVVLGRYGFLLRVASGAVTFVAAAALYGLLIEPYWLEPTYCHLALPLSRPLRIAHLSDLHTHGLGRLEREVLALLSREQPDLIVVTGDTVVNGSLTGAGHPGNDARLYQAAWQFLSRLRAPLGVYVVRGNWEVTRVLPNEREFYEKAAVSLLINESVRVRDDVFLVGLDDPGWESPDVDAALGRVPPDAFSIVLLHSPAFFDRLAGRCDLVLAGHTHGGQLRVPFVRPLWLPPMSGRFAAGWYEARGSRMYVSRGIGTSGLPVRFLCRPEVAFITVGTVRAPASPPGSTPSRHMIGSITLNDSDRMRAV